MKVVLSGGAVGQGVGTCQVGMRPIGTKVGTNPFTVHLFILFGFKIHVDVLPLQKIKYVFKNFLGKTHTCSKNMYNTHCCLIF